MTVNGVGSGNSPANAWRAQRASSEGAPAQKSSVRSAAQEATAGAPVPVSFEPETVSGASGPAIDPRGMGAPGPAVGALTPALPDADAGAAQGGFSGVRARLHVPVARGYHAHHHHGVGVKAAAGATANPISTSIADPDSASGGTIDRTA